VAILDADKEGFLRSDRSLIQIIGRAARNINGKVIMYADRITASMEFAISETNRRRGIQMEYNKAHGVTPMTVKKVYSNTLANVEELKNKAALDGSVNFEGIKDSMQLEAEIERLKGVMKEHAMKLEFEKAAEVRNTIGKLKIIRLELG
jgi:excinuclease ABC subunit B